MSLTIPDITALAALTISAMVFYLLANRAADQTEKGGQTTFFAL